MGGSKQTMRKKRKIEYDGVTYFGSDAFFKALKQLYKLPGIDTCKRLYSAGYSIEQIIERYRK